MIQYALSCANGHSFDSWFQSAEAYDKLAAAGLVACAVCGGTQVTKSLMAPAVSVRRGEQTAKDDASVAPSGSGGVLSQPASPAEQALAELKRKIEEGSDYVGKDFARVARAMHAGEAPERAIHGEARLDEARSLIEDGIPVAPLPFRPGRKSN